MTPGTFDLISKTGQQPHPVREAFAEQQWKANRLVAQTRVERPWAGY